MKYKLVKAFVLVLATLLMTCNAPKELDIWKVYYFGGQSNMDGYGYNSKFPDSLKNKISNSIRSSILLMNGFEMHHPVVMKYLKYSMLDKVLPV